MHVLWCGEGGREEMGVVWGFMREVGVDVGLELGMWGIR